MRRCALACIAVFVGGLIASPSARADTPPSAWDIARDPLARDRWRLHASARREMAFDPELGSMRNAALEHARAQLEEADAGHSPDVRLRFDLAEVYERLELHERAIAVLEPALREAPDHPAAAHTWVMAAYAYAHLDRPEDERAAYERYLEREREDRFRVTAMLNLAEADMRLGFLPEAVTGYRDTIALAVSLPMREGFMDEVLATWGLAVALDRSGGANAVAAAAAARQATQSDQRIRLPGIAGAPDHGWRLIGDTDNVFFVPSYERYWYLAMGYTEDAKQAADADVAVREWETVEGLWTRYVSQAVPGDRWVSLARAHVKGAHQELLKARGRARSGARRPTSSHD